MDDISDILNDVSRNNDPFADDVYGSTSGMHSGQADLQALTRAWVNERGAAELLPCAPPIKYSGTY
jgi:GINS complex subunit 4